MVEGASVGGHWLQATGTGFSKQKGWRGPAEPNLGKAGARAFWELWEGAGLFSAGEDQKKHQPLLPRVQNPGRVDLTDPPWPEEGRAPGWTL